jgi:two-component system NarL family sensor kinase
MARLSTGSAQFDALIEELQPQDNVVFFTEAREHYAPFVATLVRHVVQIQGRLVYVRGDGSLDSVISAHPSPVLLDLQYESIDDLLEHVDAIGADAYYVFESLGALESLVGGESGLRNLFLTVCPRLFEVRSVAYWDLAQHQFAPGTVAAVRDCTQVFIRVDQHQGDGWIVTPLKVWGRYSDAMFQPHLARTTGEALEITPVAFEALQDSRYLLALSDKNRELADVRDILNRSNDELRQRNAELAELNARVVEQSRLYESLRNNLDHLASLFRAGWEIGGTLERDQVYEAILLGCVRLFAGCSCRVYLPGTQRDSVDMTAGDGTSAMALAATDANVALARARAMRSQQTASLQLPASDGQGRASAALASLVIRGRCVGTIEIYADDGRLDEQESRVLLGYLASEGSIALDNADLYQETDLQREQLRTFVSDVIRSDERESRQLALDLHDGLVQMIVGSYQHFQAAQAWRGRDAHTEEVELGKGVQILREAIAEARRLISQLRPAGLDDFGLEQALRVYLGEARNLASWEVTFTMGGSQPTLAPEVEASLFRIVQEATTNALKYAEADALDVRFDWQSENVVLTIHDTGRGFNPALVQSQPEKGLHIGLVGIRERARMLGGDCWVDSAPGAGTLITVTVPFAGSAAGEEGPG